MAEWMRTIAAMERLRNADAAGPARWPLNASSEADKLLSILHMWADAMIAPAGVA